MASPLHRHRSSLESILDLSAVPRLHPDERTQAVSIFHKVISYCESYEAIQTLGKGRKYKRGRLLQLVYGHVISEHGRDNVLVYFLTTLTTSPYESVASDKDFPQVLDKLANFETRSEEQKNQLLNRLQELADHIVDCFFLPLKASSGKTPQPTPSLSPWSRPGDEIVAGTAQRLSSLRGSCLKRDRHRCVISRMFDEKEADTRFDLAGADAVDDDGKPLANEYTEYLEVAHIIPHSLMSSEKPDVPLNQSKVYTLRVLNMFDPGILQLLEGNIDRPFNAVTLSMGHHRRFGDLRIYFEAAPETEQRYTIKKTTERPLFQPILPVTRDLFITPNHSIEPPSPRLLAIHRACCLILQLSGAGEYVDDVLRDIEEIVIRSDGSTRLGTILSLKFTLDQQVRAR